MWMIPKSMIMTIKMKIIRMVTADHSHGPPNTIPKTGMWTQASNMGGMGRDITNTGTRNRMARWTMMRMMICGDCLHNCSSSPCFMHILWSYLALFLLGRIEVLRGYDASAFGVLVDINRWKHSVWRSPLRMDYEAFQCHLRLFGPGLVYMYQ